MGTTIEPNAQDTYTEFSKIPTPKESPGDTCWPERSTVRNEKAAPVAAWTCSQLEDALRSESQEDPSAICFIPGVAAWPGRAAGTDPAGLSAHVPAVAVEAAAAAAAAAAATCPQRAAVADAAGLSAHIPAFSAAPGTTTWPGRAAGADIAGLSAHIPDLQQQPTQGGQQPQMLPVYLPMYQYSQQPQVLQPAQGRQQPQMLQAYLPTFQYSQQPQVPQPGRGGQKGQMLHVHQPTYQQWHSSLTSMDSSHRCRRPICPHSRIHSNSAQLASSQEGCRLLVLPARAVVVNTEPGRERQLLTLPV
ncbi:uncharacterized protein [Dasypus novemcinctus]|uniref:uncharacterized protein n=1 Tax=Dasypus novemcinctus TaxID=9361 RepID=UPI00265FC073|nr:uncharacterized protein LOC131277609 [Dasypus novemcinctus]XP_058155245.1 uncharacterized protein LOC131278800 [Dasypus novemcinctus]